MNNDVPLLIHYLNWFGEGFGSKPAEKERRYFDDDVPSHAVQTNQM